MAYRVELTERAIWSLRRLYEGINAANSQQARLWFGGLERLISSLDQHPARGTVTRETNSLRHLLYGRGRNIYRSIYAIDDAQRVVTIIHIRHGARDAFTPDGPDLAH
jgi:plasmid stabilization system protein ParE